MTGLGTLDYPQLSRLFVNHTATRLTSSSEDSSSSLRLIVLLSVLLGWLFIFCLVYWGRVCTCSARVDPADQHPQSPASQKYATVYQKEPTATNTISTPSRQQQP